MNCSAQPQQPLDHAPATLQPSFLDTEAAAIPSLPPSRVNQDEPRFPGSGQIRPETNDVQKTANDPKIVTSSCCGFFLCILCAGDKQEC